MAQIEVPLNEIRNPLFKSLCEAIQSEMEKSRIPGAAIGIYHKDEIFTNSFGITHKDNPLPVTSDTIFHIGSTTKTFTATVIMMLVDEGKLELDVPVRTYLPNFKLQDESIAEKVTVRQLLTHTAGWDGDLFTDFGNGDDAQSKYVDAIMERPQYFPLGKVWAYNNTGFVIAAHIIEIICEKSYEVVVQERILDPLGMTKTFYFENQIMLHRFATGHEITKDDVRLPINFKRWSVSRSVSGAGGISSTIQDQLIYAKFHLDGGVTADGTRLISEASIKEMQAHQFTVGTPISYMGLSWMVDDYDDFRILAHGGTTPGQISAFFIVPEKDFAFTLLSNGAGYNADLRAFTTKWVRENYLDIEIIKPEPLSEQPGLSEYEAQYSMVMIGFDVKAIGDSLSVSIIAKDERIPEDTIPPPFEMQAFEPDFFVVTTENHPEKGKEFQFVRDDDGSILALRTGVRAYARET